MTADIGAENALRIRRVQKPTTVVARESLMSKGADSIGSLKYCLFGLPAITEEREGRGCQLL